MTGANYFNFFVFTCTDIFVGNAKFSDVLVVLASWANPHGMLSDQFVPLELCRRNLHFKHFLDKFDHVAPDGFRRRLLDARSPTFVIHNDQ